MTLQTGLSAFWQFENTSWTDELGVNNLTGTNSPTSVAGKVGNAVQFTSGSSQKLDHTNASQLELGVGNSSFQVWVNLVSGLNVNASRLVSKATTGGLFSWVVSTSFNGSANGFAWVFADSSINLYTVTSLTAISAGWHHVVGTWDGTNQKIYVDTVVTSVNQGAVVPQTSNSPFTIAFDNGSSSFASSAQDILIDQVGIWQGRVLSAADVAELYNGGAGLTYAQMAGGPATNYAAFSTPQHDGQSFTQMMGY